MYFTYTTRAFMPDLMRSINGLMRSGGALLVMTDGGRSFTRILTRRSSSVACPDRDGAASARRGLRIRIARAKHARELAAAQENHVWGQPAALVDPVPDLKWIHQIQRLRCRGIGHSASSGTGIPGGMKSEPGPGGHAYPVMRNRTENDGAGRYARTVDD